MSLTLQIQILILHRLILHQKISPIITLGAVITIGRNLAN